MGERERMPNKEGQWEINRKGMCSGKAANIPNEKPQTSSHKRGTNGFSGNDKKKERNASKVQIQRDEEVYDGKEPHHVEIGTDLDSSGQIPHNTIPIMPR